MAKLLVFIIPALLLIGGCGQKSVIKNQVRSVRTSEAYGDSKHTILPITIPLSDQSIASFESPLKKMAFVRGIAKMFYDLGASLGLGKVQLSLVQPIPELPTNYLHGLRIKRLFFYIEPHNGCPPEVERENSEKRECRIERLQRRFSWVRRVVSGVSNVDFNFLDKIAVKASSRPLQNVTNWFPMVAVKDLSRRDFHPLQKIFEEEEVENNENSRELILLKYSAKNREKDTNPLKPTLIFSIKKGNSPSQVKNYLTGYPKFKNAFKRIHILNRSLLVELVNDPVVMANVEAVLSENSEEIDQMGIDSIEPCDDNTCLDLKLPNVNLIPLISKNNGIQIDSYIDAGTVPGNFQLKGFIEFELKLNLTF